MVCCNSLCFPVWSKRGTTYDPFLKKDVTAYPEQIQNWEEEGEGGGVEGVVVRVPGVRTSLLPFIGHGLRGKKLFVPIWGIFFLFGLHNSELKVLHQNPCIFLSRSL